MEEAGLRLARLEPVAHAYSMPSVSSERLWLYLAPYTQADGWDRGGGLPGEGEQVEVLELPLATLADQVRSGHLADLKTLVLVQALMLRRPELFSMIQPRAPIDAVLAEMLAFAEEAAPLALAMRAAGLSMTNKGPDLGPGPHRGRPSPSAACSTPGSAPT